MSGAGGRAVRRVARPALLPESDEARSAPFVRCAHPSDLPYLIVMRTLGPDDATPSGSSLHGRRPPAAAVALLVAVCMTSLAPVRALGQERDGTEAARKRAEYFLEQREYPEGLIPSGAYARAAEALRAMPSRATPFRVPGAQSSWTDVGPHAIGPNKFVGRVNELVVDPRDPETLYIATMGGGVWKTTDGGASWTPLTDGQCALPTNSVALDPLDADIVYAGTGEYGAYPGCGLLRSEDGGATWTTLDPPLFSTPWGQGDISIDGIVLLRGSGTGASRTLLLATNRGVIRSTDGGATWTNPLTTGWFYPTTGLVVDPTDSSVAYAAVEDVYQSDSKATGIFKSTDAGATWARLGFPVDHGDASLTISATDPPVLYVSAHDHGNGSWAGLFSSSNGGKTWVRRYAAGLHAPAWYQGIVAVRPDDPSTVVVGSYLPYISTDSGQTFERTGTDIHVDVRGLRFVPGSSTLYVANDGGVYRTSNLGESWANLNANLSITTFYPGPSVELGAPSHILAGSLDNGVDEYLGSTQWAYPAGGDGGYSIIDRSRPGTAFSEYQWAYGPIRRTNGGPFSGIVSGIDTNDRAEWEPPLVVSPLNPAVLYFGTYRLYRTGDRGTSWSAVTGDITSGGNLSAIAPSPVDSLSIWVGSNHGQVLRSDDGGVSWTDVSAGLPNRYVTHIALDPSDTSVAWVTVSGFGSGHVFRTVDGGATWSDVSGDLPDAPANWVLALPQASVLIAGTDVGLFTAGLDGETWTLDSGLPNVVVSGLALDPATGTVVATTFGRGAFTVPLGATMLTKRTALRVDTLDVRRSAMLTDSAVLPLSGPASGFAPWEASAGAGTWLTLSQSTGVGYTPVRWSVDATMLDAGSYADTITVTLQGVAGGTEPLVQRLLVTGVPPLSISADRLGTLDSVPEGAARPLADSAEVKPRGTGASTATWKATHGSASWLTLTVDSGRASGTVRWSVDPEGLAVGPHTDTIVISLEGTSAPPARVVESLRVFDLTVNEGCAVGSFLGNPCLSSESAQFLDEAGNHNGRYDLGDLLRYLDDKNLPLTSASPAGAPLRAGGARKGGRP